MDFGFGSFCYDPLEIGGVGDLASMIKSLVTWAVLLLFLLFCWYETKEFYTAAAQTPQATTAGTSAFGNNVNVVSALAMAAAIMVVIVGIPVFFIGFVGRYDIAASLIGGPMGYLTPGAASWVGWANDHLLPLDLCLALVGASVVFRFGIGAVYSLSVAIIKFCVGL